MTVYIPPTEREGEWGGGGGDPGRSERGRENWGGGGGDGGSEGGRGGRRDHSMFIIIMNTVLAMPSPKHSHCTV